MRPLDPAYRACFADGSTFNVRWDIDKDLDRGRVYLPKMIFGSLKLILHDES
jgi:hypothetical protein